MTAEAVTYSLESVLKEIKDSIKSLDRKLETLDKDVTDVKIGLATLTEKVDSMDNRLIKVEGTQSNQIWTLITILSGSLIAVGFWAFFMGNNP
ncbi:Cytochrome c-type protein NrfB precursor [Microcystis aeruginosa NIES-2549]|uniref:Cytochrome c-type protein NrfB n=1 Tax=Microcystis aeruginosa NIES-2549 TaxID=1641812 RepID=A0A0F6U5K7_MICAE|nr:hypothetical protein [Microcystis aeruginosa]AKE64869.1 Cytochrome c-type protein NrfB precursor [Microcystis aeruginosa NIES-2549]AOC53268.1 Cytochrome c-type protein NrfB precursor [Microcystis aeruginosa NIES-2481]